MLGQNFGKNCKVLRLPLDTTTTYTGTAGTTTLTTEGVDTLGFTGACFLIGFGTITSGAVTSIKAAQSDDNGVADGYSDLAGTAQTVADTDDNKVFMIDIYKPQKRYLEALIVRATQNAVVDFMICVLYNAVQAPVTQDTTVGGLETFNSPAEGTA
jgi:hypothetical protein